MRMVAGAVVVVLGVMFFAGCAVSRVGVREVGEASVEEVRMADGAVLRVESPVVFDRNALAAVERAGDGVVAMTVSGALLRFDGKLRLVMERVRAGYTCLGHDDNGHLLAGRADGEVERVDVGDLSGRVVGRVPGKVAWVGGERGRVLAAVEGMRGHVNAVWDVGAQRDCALPDYVYGGATAFLVDNRERLWIGWDMGEFGGGADCLDLRDFKLQEVQGPYYEGGMPGVAGFCDEGNGGVLIYGGLDHIQLTESYVYRCRDGRTIEKLYEDSNAARSERAASENADNAFSQIVSLDGGKHYFVCSGSTVFRTDRGFAHWERVGKPVLHYAPGQVDTMDSYPAVSAALAFHGGLLLATMYDGLVTVKGGEVVSHAMGGQVDLGGFHLVGGTDEGLVGAVENHFAGYDAVLITSAQHAIPLPIPLPVDARAGEEWEDPRVAWVTPEEEVVAGYLKLAKEDRLLRIRGGKVETLATSKDGHDVIGGEPGSVGESPDGRYWKLEGDLSELKGGKWVTMSQLPEGCRFGYRFAWTGKGPWLFAAEGKLWLLKTDGEKAWVEAADVVMPDGGAVRASDVAVTEAGEVLVATERGVHRWIPGQRKLEWLKLAVNDVERLCRDEEGNMWFGGKGLWVEDKDGVHGVNELGGGAEIASMVPRPGGGVAAVLSNQTLLVARKEGIEK